MRRDCDRGHPQSARRSEVYYPTMLVDLSVAFQAWLIRYSQYPAAVTSYVLDREPRRPVQR